MHDRIRETSKASTDWTATDWRRLVPEYGEDVALAYRDGAVAYWRKFRPVLRSEGATPNSVPLKVIFGLTGISIEAAERSDWLLTLTTDEVGLACRYAAYELNGFPAWFPKLFETYPDQVAEFLISEIRYELSIESADTETHYVLSDVSWSGTWAWRQLGPAVYKLLEERDAKNSATQDKLLKILQGSDVADADLASLAEQKITSVQTTSHKAYWFALWVGVDPKNAIPRLSKFLKTLPTVEQTPFAMHFVTRLWGGRRSETNASRPAFHTPEHLKSLYLLMHEYIRRKEDIERAGRGVFSPGLRDDAQEARNRLFGALNELSGKEAFLAMDEIGRAEPEQASRAWLVTLARKKAEQDADIEPWSPDQVRDFHDKLDSTPKNHRELANLAVLRLLDLKDELENGDESVASILLRVTEEVEMRNYLGHQLREKAFGRYSIPQEEELADAKRPDLRFHGVGFDAPVPTELKLADKWTGPVLFERLESQLAGDYLRDIRSGRGVFVLVYRGNKQGWDIPGSANRVDFDDLVEALQQHWAKISGRFPSVDEITVVGIDLTKRFASSR